MVTTVRSLGLTGVSGYEVTVECMLSGGLPAFDVVGLPDAAVKEARERVRAGARFTVMRLTGKAKPQFLMAERTRSRASVTAASGRPTMVKAGRPPDRSHSAVTG